MPDVEFPTDDPPESRPAPAHKAETEESIAETPPAETQKVEADAPAESAPAKAESEKTEQPQVAVGRAEALAKLTSEATNGEEPDEAPAEKTEAEAKAEAVEKPETEGKPEPEAKKDEEVDQLDKPLSDDDLRDRKRTKQRFDDLLADRRKLREPAKLGETILKTCATAQMTPEQFTTWTSIGAGVMAGEAESIAELKKVLAQFDAEAPKTDTPPKAADGALPEWLQTKVDAYEMTPETAREVASKIVPPAAPKQPTLQDKNSPPPAERPPVLQRQNPEVLSVTKELGQLEAEWAVKHKTDWDAMRARVWTKVQAKGKASPSVMLERTKAAYELVVAEMKAKATKLPPPPPRVAASTNAVAAGSVKTGRQAALKNLTT